MNLKNQLLRTAIYLPKTWEDDLVKTLRKYPPTFKVQHIDYFKYLGQLPYYLASRLKDAYYEEGFIPVNKQKLKKRVPNYRPYLDYLIRHGFLEENPEYMPGEFSGSIRYPAKYLRQKPVRTHLRRPTLVKKMLKIGAWSPGLPEKIKPEEKHDPIRYDFLSKWLPELTIDEKRAHEINDAILEKERLNPEKYLPKKKWKPFKKGMIRRKRRKPDNFDHIGFRYNLRCLLIDGIKNGDYGLGKKDKKAGRFHTFLTNTNKEFRSTITHKGEKLISLDIKNSQPFLVIGLLDPYVYTNNSLDLKVFGYNENLENTLSEYIQEWENNQSTSGVSGNMTYMAVNTTNTGNISVELKQNKVNDDIKDCKIRQAHGEENCTTMLLNFISQLCENEDVKKYKKWVIEGVFYERFGEELLAKNFLPKDCSDPREEAKKITFKIFFGKNDSKKRVKKAVRAFREIFPSVFAIIELVKFGDPEFRSHTAFACTMQSFESDLILQHCCSTIDAERPDVPIYTIHDSIVTTLENEGYIREVMERTFHQIVGYVPKIKPEYWG